MQGPCEIYRRGTLQVEKTYKHEKTRVFSQRGVDIEAWPVVISVCDIVSRERRTMNTLLSPGEDFLELNTSFNCVNGHADISNGNIYFPRFVHVGDQSLQFLQLPHSQSILFHEIHHNQHRTELYNDKEGLHLRGLMQVGVPFIPSESTQAFMTGIIKPEDEANMFAIEMIERWRSEGIDLEPNVSLQELYAEARKALQSYMRMVDHLSSIPAMR